MYRKLLTACIFVCLGALLPLPSLAQAANADDWADALVKWDRSCSARGCLLQTDVLRGISDDPSPPDAKDAREYVSINVAVERSTRKPAYVTFLVDPRAQQSQGIFVAFTDSAKVGGSWKMTIDPDGATKLPISECTADACVSRIPFGLISEGDGRSTKNLLDKFLNSDSVLILYVRGGKSYRTMVLLSSFKKEYRHLLATEMK